jgi:hypothetical protein
MLIHAPISRDMPSSRVGIQLMMQFFCGNFIIMGRVVVFSAEECRCVQ